MVPRDSGELLAEALVSGDFGTIFHPVHFRVPAALRCAGIWKTEHPRGEMPEWSIGVVSKTIVLARVPRVRIPVSPPSFVSTL